ncbi:Mei4-dependent protein 6 [Coprinopsis cinerea okayama7|uniref:Mei4-dependent protein 6 n=1 Tax=Coprinopsis cinerea (strain Okayama-7 / 130 / ATCC MYA-4618 / FGSC 9003) TaxID=240176 RepID=A8N7N0_COPC7|nr:Mei4-dependent protein 6 [Coprinopsis cinerea okayama7\|eukprot:XP_001830836.2 Mei4-dependent protein 6 [Coprinopsis cinerea okayama7\
MKEFKIYIGMTEDNMVQVFHGGLKNNADPETFEIKHINAAGIPVPTRYVKIEPIAAHGQSFHISIWYVGMSGHNDPAYIEHHREKIVMRHILKHLRQRRLLTPFKSISDRSGLYLEHPLISKLHEKIVLQGDWSAAEQLLHSLSDAGLFTSYLHSCQPQAIWTRITGTDADGDIPSPRGGHAMCMDPDNQIVYLFGGWDGEKSLDDFWAYHVKEDRWKLLSPSTSKEHNAPGPRSCHKMVFDSRTGSIYLLGRLDDTDVKIPRPAGNAGPSNPPGAGGSTPGVPLTSTPMIAQQSPLRQQITPPESQNATPVVTPTKTYCSEFYRYQTRGLDAGKWVFLSFDTASSGGPPLVFDHQMVIDSETQILYVFGGRVVDGDWETSKFSGLYSYNIRMSKWKLLQAADLSGQPPNTIPPRFGHSMVLEPKSKQLYIFGGQREQRYLADMYVYDINTGVSTELFSNFTTSGGPDPCFTQRAVIDPLLKEIYVFCGLTRSTASSPAQPASLKTHPSNWVYRYDPKPGKWSQIARHPESVANGGEVPLPRFAHQVVYCPGERTVFLHGGNAGGLVGVGNASASSGNGAGRSGDGTRTGSPATGGGGSGVGTGTGMPNSNLNPDGAPTTTGDAPGISQSPVPPVPASSSAEPVSANDRNQLTGISTKEKRLDDFWKMELRRPQVSEVIRRAKFHIRRQQFREMCEETTPVRALQFLQTQVSHVVDHKNPDESETFRGLLTYLLAPSMQSARPPVLPVSASMVSGKKSRSGSQVPREGGSGEVGSSVGRGETERENGVGTERRRRESEESAVWTNVLPEDEYSDAHEDAIAEDDEEPSYPHHRSSSATSTSYPNRLATHNSRGTADMLRGIVDPLEFAPYTNGHGLSAAGGTSSHLHDQSEVGSTTLKPVSLTSERYHQRTEVFSSILEFVAEEDKEPEGDLLHLVVGREPMF